MKTLSKFDPADREGWLKLRLQGLGGSDAAAIMGVDPWRSAYDVYMDRVSNNAEEGEFNEAAHWGNVLEDSVAKEFADRNNVFIRKSNKVYQHDKHPWMLATIDRFITTSQNGSPVAILEIKTRNAYAQHDWEKGVPMKVYWQVQHYLAVSGFPYGHVAVLIGGQKFQSYQVERNESDIERLIAAEQDLWTRIIDRNPPEMRATTETVERLDAIMADPTKVVEFTPDEVVDLYTLKALNRHIKEAEAQRDDIIVRIKARMDSAIVGTYDGTALVKWAPVVSKRLDTKALRAAGVIDPKDMAKYEVESSSRTFKLLGDLTGRGEA